MAPINCTDSSGGAFLQGDSITGNLIGGITPFFALLGESFTNRFLSQSVSIGDYVIFAMIPTGVPFAVKAIIRAARASNLLKAIALYPDEDEKKLEMDLLPTTSDEVCEIWNGSRAQRVFAPSSESPLSEWIFHGDTLCRSREAKSNGLLTPMARRKKYKNQHEWVKKAEYDLPPNLILNLGPRNRVRNTTILSIMGVFLQSGVIIFAALTCFYNPVRCKFFVTATLATRILSFVFVCAGTLLLTTALIYTARVIDASEYVSRWKPTKESTLVIWKQEENTDLGTKRYLVGKSLRKELLCAHRPPGARPSASFPRVTVVAVVVGFLIQSVGISIIHWPVQTWQLLAMVVMFLGRSYLRRVERPQFVRRLNGDISHGEFRDIAKEWSEVYVPPKASRRLLLGWLVE